MSAIQIIALFDMGSEKAQLPCRPATFTHTAGLGQASLGNADLGNRVAAPVNLVSYGNEKCCPLGTCQMALEPRRFLRLGRDSIDMDSRAGGEGMSPRARWVAFENCFAHNPFSSDQMFSGHHDILISEESARSEVAHQSPRAESPFGAFSR